MTPKPHATPTAFGGIASPPRNGPILFFNFSGRDLPDYARKSFDSMLVANGRVVDRGFALETMSRFQKYQSQDLHGSTVLPAFADAHVHFLQTGLMLDGCSLEQARSLDEVFDLLKTHAKSDLDPWILGWNLDETNLREKRLPTIFELTRLESRRKVWVSRVDLHSAIPNSAAEEWAKSFFPEMAPINGVFKGNQFFQLSSKVIQALPRAMKKRALEKARERCLLNGVATVHALEGGFSGDESDVQQTADFLAESGFHGLVYHQSEDPSLALKNEWNRIGGCLFVDGSFGSRTAALHAPYADDPENSGLIFRNREKLEELVRMASVRGLQLAMHAIGDRALTLLTSAMAWGRDFFGLPPLPHRIEHFELPDNEALRSAKYADAFISVQPAFEVFWGGKSGMYAQRLGLDRASRTNPFRTILGCGLPLAGGSDSPVTPINPMLGIHGFVNHSNHDEKIDLNSALSSFILEPHRFGGEESARGRLEKGFHADFICLFDDPFMVSPGRLKDQLVSALFIGGKQAK